MKDSQLTGKGAHLVTKYIKADNERFSTHQTSQGGTR